MSGHESDADFLRSVANACDGMANGDPTDTTGARLRFIANTLAIRERGHAGPPQHYTPNGATVQPIALIEAQGLGFSEGNVVKYVCRARHKGEEVRDLEKALYYLTRLLEQARARE